MKWLSIALAIALAGITANVSAQELGTTGTRTTPATTGFQATPVASTQPTTTLSEDYLRQLSDPSFQVWQRARARADMRIMRIESRRWYGVSNARPAVSVGLHTGYNGPRWTGGNPWHPNQWSAGTPLMVVRPTVSSSR